MNEVYIQNKVFQLKGETIQSGEVLSFKAVDQNGKEVNLNNVEGVKVLSFFPDISTSVCDAQTLKIAQLAKTHKNVKFISLTTDAPEKISKWCQKKSLTNLSVWSDAKHKEFQNKTNLYIASIGKLTRGLIVLDNQNKIINMSLNKEVAQEPNWDVLNDYLN